MDLAVVAFIAGIITIWVGAFVVTHSGMVFSEAQANCGHIITVFIILGLCLLSFMLSPGLKPVHNPVPNPVMLLAGLSIGLADGYLIALLWGAATYGLKQDKVLPLPQRHWALILVTAVALGIVSAFGGLTISIYPNVHHIIKDGHFHSTLEVIFFSLQKIFTLGAGGPEIVYDNNDNGYILVILGTLSGLLLLLVAFPVLGARIGDFSGGQSKKDKSSGCLSKEDKSADAKLLSIFKDPAKPGTLVVVFGTGSNGNKTPSGCTPIGAWPCQRTWFEHVTKGVLTVTRGANGEEACNISDIDLINNLCESADRFIR